MKNSNLSLEIMEERGAFLPKNFLNVRKNKEINLVIVGNEKVFDNVEFSPYLNIEKP